MLKPGPTANSVCPGCDSLDHENFRA